MCVLLAYLFKYKVNEAQMMSKMLSALQQWLSLALVGPSGPGQVGSQAISLPTIITDKLFTPPTIFDTRGHVIIYSCKEGKAKVSL